MKNADYPEVNRLVEDVLEMKISHVQLTCSTVELQIPQVK